MFWKDSRLGVDRRRCRKLGSVGAAAVLALAVLLCPVRLHAQAKVGTTGAQFLELGVSARAMGMAEAFVAVADDISAAYYNPAGLTYLYGREAAFTYIKMPADVGYGFAALGLPLESIGGVLGIGMYALSSGYIDETTYDKIPTGRRFWWNDFSLAVSYSRFLTDLFSIGITVK